MAAIIDEKNAIGHIELNALATKDEIILALQVQLSEAKAKLTRLVEAANELVIETEKWYKSIDPKNLGLSKLKAAVDAAKGTP